MSIWIVLKLLGSLALLMFGMKTMSDALQKMAGPQLRHVLGAMTTNRFTGMLTGMVVTASVQSSTATTVMTVSFVNAGLLTLAQAISVIMGANIGTTLTAWIMSAGMSFDITSVVYPAFFLGIILIYQKRYRYFGDFLFGLSFLLLGLGTLRATGTEMNLGENEALLNFFSSFDPTSFLTTIVFLLLGGILTFCVQSSAAVMAITMILCSSGALPIYQGIALVLGENIGTTITSNLAALSANTQARRAAFAHMFFNVFGVIWILFVFRPFINMVCGWVGYDVNMNKEAVDAATFMANAAKLSFVLAAEDFRLHFITAGFMRTPELSVLEAQKEISSFAERMQRMFGMVKELLYLSSSALNADKNRESNLNKLYSRIEKYESISDNMELEIGQYLEQVSDAHLSDDTKGKIRAMLREVSELESIGDSCYNLARTINRKFVNKQEHFTDKQYERLYQMIALTNQALTNMNMLMAGRKEDYDINLTFNLENEINNFRNQLKAQNISDVNNHEYTYAEGTTYIDLVNECEKLADYVVNVVEARMGVRQRDL